MQLIGVISVVAYTFSVMYILLKLINRFVSLRVSADVERIGLNAGEHGATSEVYLLAEKMHAQSVAHNFSNRVEINPHSDIGALQVEYNSVLDAVQSEVEKRQAIETELRLRATTDGLTQLSNRQHFDEILNKEWHRAQRDQKCLSLLFADIDHFKEYNDCYGHQAGDLCLVNISKAIASSVHRATDLVARYGGEEFTILLPSADLKGATAFAEQVRIAIVALQIKTATSEEELFVTISVGVASIHPHQGSSSHHLIEMADDALYRAKKLGRNRIEVCTQQT